MEPVMRDTFKANQAKNKSSGGNSSGGESVDLDDDDDLPAVFDISLATATDYGLRLTNGPASSGWQGGGAEGTGVGVDFILSILDDGHDADGADPGHASAASAAAWHSNHCKASYGSTFAYSPIDAVALLRTEYGTDFLTPKSQCQYYEDINHAGWAWRTSDECNWADKLKADKSSWEGVKLLGEERGGSNKLLAEERGSFDKVLGEERGGSNKLLGEQRGSFDKVLGEERHLRVLRKTNSSKRTDPSDPGTASPSSTKLTSDATSLLRRSESQISQSGGEAGDLAVDVSADGKISDARLAKAPPPSDALR
jgi:hypothetical protein